MRRRHRDRPAGQVPRSKWHEAGIVELTNDQGLRTPTHSRGDRYAADVIEGRVPWQQAVRDRIATEAMLADMAAFRRRVQDGEWSAAEWFAWLSGG